MIDTPHDTISDTRPDGSILLRSRLPIGPIARNSGVWMHRWAKAAPERVFLAERSGAGWRTLTYGALLQQVRAVGSWLLGRGLGPDRPLVILSGNGIEHAVLALAGQYVGVPTVALAEQYALVKDAHPRLIHAVQTVRPGLAFASDGRAYRPALALDCLAGVEKLVVDDSGAATPWTAALAGDAGVDVDAAAASVGPDTLAKIIFTSGSTAQPKGVITTHGMLCTNQAQILAAMPLLGARPHKIVDWLPWNHVFGGSHNVNMMLANGGSLYIDDGKPTRSGMAATIRNITEQGGTLAFNVPIGFSQLVAAMRTDQALKRAYLGDCDLIFYAAASVPGDVWDALRGFAEEVRGSAPPMYSGWGMSETAPSCFQTHEKVERPGNIGVPLPLITAKLLPDESGRCELRVAGPNVTPGYYDDPAKTKEAFDEEGFLITGDAVRFLDPADANAGLIFDGRIAEDFKLLTGTWVRATTVRLDALQHFADIASDVVVTGHDREEIGLLVFPHAGAHEAEDGVVTCGELRGAVTERLRRMAASGGGSSTRIMRALILAAPASMSEGELTAKGSINARRVLVLRKGMLERLYRNDDTAVIRLETHA